MTEPMQQLRIIAQPKAFFRERYGSELDQAENTAKRYIRAEDNNQLNLEYPTIERSYLKMKLFINTIDDEVYPNNENQCLIKMIVAR
ncbi:unnamed protein product [Rotaria sp. Silwood1]|nr:unnamed protein product [Rotaria sp. Silwood1]CAF1459333.1 unnamed protein product [Rotaria sp. Silwood1]